MGRELHSAGISSPDKQGKTWYTYCMNKKFLYYFIVVVIIGTLPKTASIIRTHFEQKQDTTKIVVCENDTIACSDGTVVKRISPHCEFASCPINNEMATTSTQTETATTSSSSKQFEPTTSSIPTSLQINTNKEAPADAKPTSKIPSIITTIINIVTAPFSNSNPSVVTYTDPTIMPSSYASSSSSTAYKPLPPENFAGEKFIVKDGNILTSDNKLVYNIPESVIASVSNPSPGWTNTIINVVQVGTVAPILPNNAIPIADLPGKYYLSQNSFGNLENCEFSNKIFILDTVANTTTLLYEENNTTLTRDDPRACNSEIFLLTTESNKLILKYHTIGTNTLCDSAWSEPEKTYYLDVTKLRTEGMKKYIIPDNLSSGAEAEEEACRAGL
jgi:hypothetical protein